MKYKLFIHDREYTNWSYINEETFQQEQENPFPQVNPITYKWFNKDIILYDPQQQQQQQQQEPSITTTYSYIRNVKEIAGILVLENNKTYGREHTKKSNKKLLYKCIPDDKHLPIFLIPYEPQIHFTKVFKNKYVLFKFDNWDETHPYGKLTETIGDVDNYEHFYEYQLYCKSLHISLTHFTNKTREQLQNNTIEQILSNPNFHIEDRRTHLRPITIDPKKSTDFDDAFSIFHNNDKTHITIYIANVFIWLETLNLWKSFTNRVSTIYLPDKKRPMLPTILSDQLCSLQEGQDRFTFALDLVYYENTLIQSSFKTALVNVSHNYRYESPQLQQDTQYNLLYDFTRTLDKNITDSHDVVAYWMVKMNSITGEEMAKHKTGIYRQATLTRTINEIPLSDNLSQSAKRTITMWNNVSGQYVLYSENIHHDIMKLSNYTHVTSPIRRIVDLLNQMLIYMSHTLVTTLSDDAQEFLDKWLHQLPYINTSMRSIRKIQTDCEILYRCISNPSLLESQHTGILFDKIQKNDGGFVYMIYLETLNLLTRLKTYTEYENYSTQPLQLFLFMDEHSLKKKIRVQICESQSQR